MWNFLTIVISPVIIILVGYRVTLVGFCQVAVLFIRCLRRHSVCVFMSSIRCLRRYPVCVYVARTVYHSCIRHPVFANVPHTVQSSFSLWLCLRAQTVYFSYSYISHGEITSLERHQNPSLSWRSCLSLPAPVPRVIGPRPAAAHPPPPAPRVIRTRPAAARPPAPRVIRTRPSLRSRARRCPPPRRPYHQNRSLPRLSCSPLPVPTA